ncbi:hypothetical protein ACLOJK_014465 [Asimina triloba]
MLCRRRKIQLTQDASILDSSYGGRVTRSALPWRRLESQPAICVKDGKGLEDEPVAESSFVTVAAETPLHSHPTSGPSIPPKSVLLPHVVN